MFKIMGKRFLGTGKIRQDKFLDKKCEDAGK
jgi:hypothetical protein